MRLPVGATAQPWRCIVTRAPAPEGALRNAAEAEILAFSGTVRRTRPCEYGLAGAGGIKGQFGCLVEHIFGLSCDNLPEPDFRVAGIELKSTKLKWTGGAWKVGERTSLHQIDYQKVATETWTTASIKKKLGKIIFCFYRWVPSATPDTWLIDEVYYWQPDDLQWRYIEADWRVIQDLCARGKAHELSESLTLVLGAATKAATGMVRRAQANGGPPARPRAFSFKQPFVRALHEIATGRPRLESLSAVLGITDVTRFESTLLTRMRKHEGHTIAQLAALTGVRPTIAKNYSSIVLRRVVKRLLGVRDATSEIREFLEFGTEMRVVPMTSSGRPKEAMSFPAFSYSGLLAEEWETSDLRDRLDRLFIVPIWRPEPTSPPGEWRLGRVFFWSPTSEQWDTIHREWQRFRREIREGKAKELTPASETEVIHVRPHGRDGKDTDVAPVVGAVVKKSFWLNQNFVGNLVLEHDPSGSALGRRRSGR